MTTVTLHIPDDLKDKLIGDRGDIGGTLQLAAAFSLCQRGQLSTSQAARLAGLTYGEFLDAAAQAKIELFPISIEELTEETRRGYTLGGRCLPGHTTEQGGPA